LVDSRVIIWSMNQGGPRSILKGHTRQANALLHLPEHNSLCTASLDSTIRFWDLNTAVNTYYRSTPSSHPIRATRYHRQCLL
jgi:WD40 repeat protein